MGSGTPSGGVALPSAASDTDTYTCTICLDEEGEVVQKGCCCRGDSGAAHVECLVQMAVHSTESLRNDLGWTTCGVCKNRFTGDAQLGLARAWYKRTESLAPEDRTRLYSTSVLCNALFAQGKYAEAVDLEVAVVALHTERVGRDHPDTLTAVRDPTSLSLSLRPPPPPTMQPSLALLRPPLVPKSPL